MMTLAKVLTGKPMRAAILLAGLCLVPAIVHGQSATENHNVDFMTSHTLGDVLKSGLRPWQTSPGVFVDGSERWVTIYLQRRRSFRMLAASSRFHVLKDFRIQSAVFSSTIMPVTHGREAVYHVLRYLGIPNAGIDELIAGMGTQPDISKFWTGEMELEERLVTVQVRPRVLQNQTGLNFSVTVVWPIENAGDLTVTEPLDPPPGYKARDIAPPKDLSEINPAPAKPVADFEKQAEDVFENRKDDYYR